MLLDVNNTDVRVTIRRNTATNRMKLTIEYPSVPEYRQRVMSALSDLMNTPPDSVAQGEPVVQGASNQPRRARSR